MRKLLLAAVCLAPLAAHAQPAGFQATVAGISTSGMSSAERTTFGRCRTQAQSVYQTAYATQPFYADTLAISYMRDCLVSAARAR